MYQKWDSFVDAKPQVIVSLISNQQNHPKRENKVIENSEQASMNLREFLVLYKNIAVASYL